MTDSRCRTGHYEVSQGHLVPVDEEVTGICHRDTEAAWGAPTGHVWDNLRIIFKKIVAVIDG